jgi:selenide,water dikinase
LAGLPQNHDPNLLVGFDTSDDAGVYRLTDEIAVVTTADFITPPVDDSYRFGQIAAANALGDVYAMGGRPVACLNLVCFPSRKLPAEVLEQIVAGALGKITEAGAVLAGGHSVEDDEPKFGLAVTGVVHPKKVWRNRGAQPGDVLVLTKPIGSGVLFNANLKGWVSEDDLKQCLQIVSTLNRRAAEVIAGNTVNAATDVTGFGLAGHAFEMAKASQACLQIDIDAVPVMDGALRMYRRGMSTGSNEFNRRLVAADTFFSRKLPSWHEQLFYDPQTSGGLLVSIPEAGARERIDVLHDAGIVHATQVGRVGARSEGPFLSFR